MRVADDRAQGQVRLAWPLARATCPVSFPDNSSLFRRRVDVSSRERYGWSPFFEHQVAQPRSRRSSFCPHRRGAARALSHRRRRRRVGRGQRPVSSRGGERGRFSRGRRLGRRRRRHHPRAARAPRHRLARGGRARGRRAGRRRQRRRHLPRHRADAGSQHATARALPDDGVGCRRGAGGRAEQGRPLRRSGRPPATRCARACR